LGQDPGLPFGKVVLGQNEDGRSEIVALAGNIPIHLSQSGFSGYGSLGFAGTQGTISDLAVERNQDGRIEVFATPEGGAVLHFRQSVPNAMPTSRGWEQQTLVQPAPDVRLQAPMLRRRQDGRLVQFARGSDTKLWYVSQTAPGGSWGTWHHLTAPTDVGFAGAFSLALGQNQDGRLELFAVQRGELWHVREG
jgi:hypothetical protein